MGWFGSKSNHEKQVAAMMKIAVNLYEQTYVVPASRGTTPLRFELPDSRFRYLMFCLSIVHGVCARRMKNADAVLNECARNLILGSIGHEGADLLFDKPVSDSQRVAHDGMRYLGIFLQCWSAYIEIPKPGKQEAATRLVATMLRKAESDAPSTSGDWVRLWPVALALEDRFNDISGAFVALGG